MVTNRFSYPSAVTATAGEDAIAAQRAINWFAARAQEVGGEPLLLVPGRANTSADPLIEQVSKSRGVRTETWRTVRGSGWAGGPVLAAWPDEQNLIRIADDHRTRALAVITWNPEDVASWIAAASPTRLGPAEVQRTPADSATDPVVAQGLLTLTNMVNHANALAGSLDHRDAVAVLLTLHDGGHKLDPQAIYSWAITHEWPVAGAERLRELATAISTGKRPRIKKPYPLRNDILETWRAAASDRA